MPDTKEIKILIVDDEEAVLALLTRWLTDRGYDCLKAATGRKALDLLASQRFSLVILDINLPDISGMEILHVIQEQYRELPVIMATSLETRLYLDRSIGSGAYGFISKPFVQNEVISNVAGALRRAELERENKAYQDKLEALVAERTQALETQKDSVQHALDELRRLINTVVVDKNLDLRFENKNLQECYRIKNCDRTDCPSYGKGPVRCWQRSGTCCNGEIQASFASKYENCLQCPVYKASTPDVLSDIGESFNNMMNLLDHKHRQLEESYQQLKSSQEQIIRQEKMASIGQLSAGIAHEINNPVGFVTSNLSSLSKYIAKLNEFITLQEEALAGCENSEIVGEIRQKKRKMKIDFILEDIEDLIRESQDGCGRIKSIVGDLKSFSREDTDKPELQDINELLSKTLNVVWNELKYKAKVERDFGELDRTICFPRQLSQVFMNLLVNAAHAIEKNGRITITTRQENDSIVIAISDTGCGIPKENLEKIFQAFYTTKADGVGTGLGLSICHGIMEKHNGSIAVESVVGEGSTFTIRIPVRDQLLQNDD